MQCSIGLRPQGSVYHCQFRALDCDYLVGRVELEMLVNPCATAPLQAALVDGIHDDQADTIGPPDTLTPGFGRALEALLGCRYAHRVQPVGDLLTRLPIRGVTEYPTDYIERG